MNEENTYTVKIIEYLIRTVKIKAEDEEDAYNKTENLINNEDIVLDYHDFKSRDINIISEDEDFPADEDLTKEKTEGE